MDQRRALKLAGIGFAAAGIGLAAVAVIGTIMGRMPRATVGATPTALAPLPAATLALERPAATSTEAPIAPTSAPPVGTVPCYPLAMPAALLAFLLATAIVDPRLEEPLRLLAEVGARDATDGYLSVQFAGLGDGTGLRRGVWVTEGTLGRSRMPTTCGSPGCHGAVRG
jgi:hypothetical protein